MVRIWHFHCYCLSSIFVWELRSYIKLLHATTEKKKWVNDKPQHYTFPCLNTLWLPLVPRIKFNLYSKRLTPLHFIYSHIPPSWLHLSHQTVSLLFKYQNILLLNPDVAVTCSSFIFQFKHHHKMYQAYLTEWLTFLWQIKYHVTISHYNYFLNYFFSFNISD